MIAIGVLLGAALIGYGVWRMTAPEPGAVTPAKADAPTFRVVTAARSISRGQVVSVEDLQTTTVLGAAPPGALTAPADAVGKVAVADIQPQQLVLSSLISADPAAAGLALLVPIGQRVISVDTTDEIAVAGFLRPGDIVDIELVLPGDAIATRGTGGDLSEARTLLQNIQVMTVGASRRRGTSPWRCDRTRCPSSSWRGGSAASISACGIQTTRRYRRSTARG
ncbi:Flp pilus assembly protein CpaB [Phenylobacterium sp. J426]|uniref:Flp pilus assembly protein CpaB n=1 Tax=Phenylobacterium sp. J426 TaxID=2898439 RepID=UPI0021518300|nr:Flp pilus assembly protein CpaB [Phenylobacterium sp. J426]MCR5876685.1 Flp pilus assembly protein CpaB [Phenylobacterium sp. J426]